MVKTSVPSKLCSMCGRTGALMPRNLEGMLVKTIPQGLAILGHQAQDPFKDTYY